MFEKMCRVLDILHMRCGFDCDMRWTLDEGWTCHVNYINEGPEFDYDIPLDGHILAQTPVAIVLFIIGECLDVIDVHPDPEPADIDSDPEPADIDSDLGYDPYLGCVTDEV